MIKDERKAKKKDISRLLARAFHLLGIEVDFGSASILVFSGVKNIYCSASEQKKYNARSICLSISSLLRYIQMLYKAQFSSA